MKNLNFNPVFDTQTIILLILFVLSILFILYDKRMIIWLRFAYPNEQARVVYYLLFKAFKKSKQPPKYILETFFNGDDKYQMKILKKYKYGSSFWRKVYEKHAKNLIACLSREKIDYRDIKYFDHLTKDRFDNVVLFKYNDYIFGEFVGHAKMWALYGDVQQAARLGAIAIKYGITTPKDNQQYAKRDHWIKVLGLRDEEYFEIKTLFDHPFTTDSSRLSLRSVYNNGIEILDYLYQLHKITDFTDAINYVEKELSSKKFDEFRITKS